MTCTILTHCFSFEFCFAGNSSAQLSMHAYNALIIRCCEEEIKKASLHIRKLA